MKPIKFCLVLSALATEMFFSSCDNRKDYFIEVNNAPILSLVKNGVELTGSTLADSLKIGEPISFHYVITDEEKIRIQVTQEDQVTLLAKDSFGEEATFSITFTVFRNIAPVALFTVTKIGVSSPYEYEVDASGSYDKDARFNGKIVEYEYTLNNYTFSTTLSKIRYIFGSAGQKLIKVRVKDNTGDWSALVSEYVVLN